MPYLGLIYEKQMIRPTLHGHASSLNRYIYGFDSIRTRRVRTTLLSKSGGPSPTPEKRVSTNVSPLVEKKMKSYFLEICRNAVGEDVLIPTYEAINLAHHLSGSAMTKNFQNYSFSVLY